MKRFILGILVLFLIAGFAVAQTSATLAISGTIATSIQVSLNGVVAGGAYNFSIPAIAADGTFADVDTATDLYYMSNVSSCSVSVSSLNQDATTFRLTDGTNFIPYIVSVGSYDCDVSTNQPIAAATYAYAWTAPAGGSDIHVSNLISISGLPAGAYTDTITFTITAP